MAQNVNKDWEYIGDGVYVKFDGYGFQLHANHHEHPTDKIYLEPEVLAALNRYAKRIEDFNKTLNQEIRSKQDG